MRVRKLLRHADSGIDKIEITYNGQTLISGDSLDVFRSDYADLKVDLFGVYPESDGKIVMFIAVKCE